MNWSKSVGFPFNKDFNKVRDMLSEYGIMSIEGTRSFLRSHPDDFFYVCGDVVTHETVKRFGKNSTKFILIDDTSSTVLTVDGLQSQEFVTKIEDGDMVVAKLSFKDNQIKVIGLHLI